MDAESTAIKKSTSPSIKKDAKKVFYFNELVQQEVKDSPLFKEYSQKVNELKSIVEKIDPAGALTIYVAKADTKYEATSKLPQLFARALEKVYTPKAVINDFDLTFEYKEIRDHAVAINRVIEKRFVKRKKAFDDRIKKKELNKKKEI